MITNKDELEFKIRQLKDNITLAKTDLHELSAEYYDKYGKQELIDKYVGKYFETYLCYYKVIEVADEPFTFVALSFGGEEESLTVSKELITESTLTECDEITEKEFKDEFKAFKKNFTNFEKRLK